MVRFENGLAMDSNGPKNFHQYVMHRVGEILETSNAEQWQWVPSKSNPADFGKNSLEMQPSAVVQWSRVLDVKPEGMAEI